MIIPHVGDATQPDLAGQLVIAHVLSDVGAYGKGFAKAVAVRHPRAKTRFQAWARGDPTSGTARPFRLGATQWVGVGHDLGPTHTWSDRWVANMVAQHGLGTKNHPLDLDALAECLTGLANAGVTVVMPRIGCGLAGGTWDEVKPVIDATLKDVDVHVYTLN